MLYVQLDVNWPDHPKIIRAGLGVAGVYAAVLCLAARGDGTVDPEDLSERGVHPALIARMIEGDLLAVTDGRLVPMIQYPVSGSTRRWIPVSVRREVMERDGFACLECGAVEDLSLDHIVPHSHGGPETVENLRVLCRPCNSRKRDRV